VLLNPVFVFRLPRLLFLLPDENEVTGQLSRPCEPEPENPERELNPDNPVDPELTTVAGPGLLLPNVEKLLAELPKLPPVLLNPTCWSSILFESGRNGSPGGP